MARLRAIVTVAGGALALAAEMKLGSCGDLNLNRKPVELSGNSLVVGELGGHVHFEATVSRECPSNADRLDASQIAYLAGQRIPSVAEIFWVCHRVP